MTIATATYLVACFQLTNAMVKINEKSASFSDLEWLRIYNAALKRAELMTRSFYLLTHQ